MLEAIQRAKRAKLTADLHRLRRVRLAAVEARKAQDNQLISTWLSRYHAALNK